MSSPGRGQPKGTPKEITNGYAHALRRARHSFLKTTENEPFTPVETTITVLSIILFVLTFPVAIIFSLLVLAEFERAVILRLGHLKQNNPHGPGIIFFLPCIDEWIRIDLRVISYDVPSQQILTKDSVTVNVDAVVYYRIYDPLRSVIQVDNVHMATKRLAQTTLRNVAGTKRIIELLTEKDSVVYAIAKMLDEGTEPWGVKVERVEIKDVRLPPLLQRAMAAEAEASREAQAKIAAAEGELAASQALREAADVMSANPVTLQLRYLQTLSLISGDQNHNVIFPFPVNLIRDFIDAMGGTGGTGNPDEKDRQRQNTNIIEKSLAEGRYQNTSNKNSSNEPSLCSCKPLTNKDVSNANHNTYVPVDKLLDTAEIETNAAVCSEQSSTMKGGPADNTEAVKSRKLKITKIDELQRRKNPTTIKKIQITMSACDEQKLMQTCQCMFKEDPAKKKM